MTQQSYPFEGGSRLASMGATWFVSYAYHDKVDPTHRNWERVSTAQSRIGQYNSTSRYHDGWLKEILEMNPANLNKNTIGLSAQEVRCMAQELLEGPTGRLRSFEEMLRFVQDDMERKKAEMAQLQAQGKERSATFKQYLADKLFYQRLLALYDKHGLL